MRRIAPAVLALMFAPAAHAASLNVSPQLFSPARGRLAVAASLTLPRQVGVQLVTPGGRSLGWISAPERRREISYRWNGRINGGRVPDGRYLVRLVFGSAAVAETPLRIDAHAPELGGLRVGNGSTPFAGDGKLLTTISPNGDGLRDEAIVRFRLREPAVVRMEVARTTTKPVVVWSAEERLPAGPHRFVWRPAASLRPRTYQVLLTTRDEAGNRALYGATDAFVGRYAKAPVVRLQGIDAAFTRQSYAPGQAGLVRISTDSPSLGLKVFRVGPDQIITYADDQLAGIEIPEAAQTIDWSKNVNATHDFVFRVGAWPSGLYYLQFGSPDGRIGYAPFVVRPAQLGATSRVAVVLPTNSWQAYNFQDLDGNGYGDTWYAGGPNPVVDLRRPYNNRGVPPRFYRYDLPFLHWLFWTGKTVDFISDADFQLIASGDDLAKAYDLVVFEGHEEYVTERMYDLVTRYRDVGGNLMFLSANNFFWRVRKVGQTLRKTGQFRQIGKPEARLLGVQYRANDDGRKQGLFIVRSAVTAPWVWTGTGLGDGSTLRRVRRRLRDRDRRDDRRVTARDARARGHPRPVRPGDHSADELLRDACGRKGVRRGRARLRRLGDLLACAAHARQRLGEARRAVDALRLARRGRGAPRPRSPEPAEPRARGTRAICAKPAQTCAGFAGSVYRRGRRERLPTQGGGSTGHRPQSACPHTPCSFGGATVRRAR